jgi:hypothetical protein
VPRLASATGSGDSSIAGFLTAFLRGSSIEEALKYATALGWQNVQVLDAVSGVRSREETVSFIAGRFPLIEANIKGPGWRWSEEHQLWAGPGDPVSAAF